MDRFEELLIDACAALPGVYLVEVYELGELGYFHAIIGVFAGEESDQPDDLFEMDYITELMHGFEDGEIVVEFERRIRETTGLFEDIP